MNTVYKALCDDTSCPTPYSQNSVAGSVLLSFSGNHVMLAETLIPSRTDVTQVGLFHSLLQCDHGSFLVNEAKRK